MMAEWVVAALLLLSGVLVLSAAVGLWRLPDIFQRMHAPSLAATLGTWAAALASVVYFTAAGGHLTLHVWLIAILLSITAPVTTMLVARAALFRGRQAGAGLPAPLGGRPLRAEENDPGHPDP